MGGAHFRRLAYLSRRGEDERYWTETMNPTEQKTISAQDALDLLNDAWAYYTPAETAPAVDKAEELSLDIKAWVPALTEGMSKDEASKHKQWSPKAIRALIAACPTSNDMDVELIGYSYVVFNGKFGPYAAILADNPEYAEKLTKEVIDL